MVQKITQALMDLCAKPGQVTYQQMARTALEVMREPTEQMRFIGYKARSGSWMGIWRAMIDEALSSSSDEVAAPPNIPLNK